MYIYIIPHLLLVSLFFDCYCSMQINLPNIQYRHYDNLIKYIELNHQC
jgi:hypothetical protein